MRTFLGVIIGIVLILVLTIKIFGHYKSTSVLSNEAAFEVYCDTNLIDVDEYFDLPKGSFHQDSHVMVCKLPVEIQDFKPSYAFVKTDLTNIDCNEEYQEEKHLKYEPFELKGTTFVVMLVKRNANLLILDTPGGANFIVAKKVMSYADFKGKINRLQLSKNGFNEYCNSKIVN